MSAAPRFSVLCADLLQAGIAVRFTATGPSMAPAIRDGDVITVAPLDAGEIADGEVVLYRNARGLTAHRVTGRVGSPAEAFRVQGAGAGSEAESVSRVQILGRLKAVERASSATTRLLRLAGRLRRAAALAGFQPDARFAYDSRGTLGLNSFILCTWASGPLLALGRSRVDVRHRRTARQDLSARRIT